MRVVVQRVSKASVVVEGETVGAIGVGLLLFLGIGDEDSDADIAYLTEKIVHLRIFPDDMSRMNRSLPEIGGEALVISQFTLYGDCRKGRRPDFTRAAKPELARELYKRFCDTLAAKGIPVQRGVFQAHMDVSLVNDGPVTLLLDSKRLF